MTARPERDDTSVVADGPASNLAAPRKVQLQVRQALLASAHSAAHIRGRGKTNTESRNAPSVMRRGRDEEAKQGTVPAVARRLRFLGVRAPEPGYSWLCRDRVERERFLDIDGAMMRTNTWLTLLLVVLVLPTLVDARLLGQLILLATALCFILCRATYRRFGRPEVAVALMLITVEVGLAAAIVADGVQHTGALAILFWPAAGFSARYPPRVAAAAAVFIASLIVVAELAFGGSVVIHEPIRLTALLGGLIAVTAITNGARRADIEHRHVSNHDPLTGLFNRTALERRVPEVEYQSRLNREPVAVVVGDIDHFKAINDEHGHTKGDAVLREVASTIRNGLRAFDPVYRLGGEEFVTLLLGRDAMAAGQVAESLRLAICEKPIAGLPITMSFGVASSGADDAFCWEDVFRAADEALYSAKRNGRDRVCLNRCAESPSPETSTANGPVANGALRSNGAASR
jgi:diguanylate cyclase (GGDEF)-like protein